MPKLAPLGASDQLAGTQIDPLGSPGIKKGGSVTLCLMIVFENPTVLALPLELYSSRSKQVRLETQFYEAPSSATITILDLPPRLCARSRAVRGLRSFRKELVGAVRLVGSCVRLSIPYTLTQDKDRVRTVPFAHSADCVYVESSGVMGWAMDAFGA